MKKQRIKYLKHFFYCFLFLLAFTGQSQEKSTNIQVINGKRYYIHKVEKNQSIYGIAKLYNVDINVLLAENDEAIDGLKNGQELKIPVSPGALIKPVPVYDSVKYVYHKVEKKETIYSICKQYNISDKKLSELNPEISSGIKQGQMLIVAEKKAATPVVNVVPRDTVVTVSRSKKAIYNIGLFLPFKLNEFDAIDPALLVQNKSAFPQLQSLSIDFYLGFKKAVDSLKEKDFDINILLYDCDDKDSLKLETTCKTSEFKSLDLIIGPLYVSGFKIVSGYAKQSSIPVVTPFTQQNKILFKNNLTSKVSPSQFTLIESLADYCVDSLKNSARFFIINDGNIKDAQYVKAFKQEFTQRLRDHHLSLVDTVEEVKGLSGFKAKYTPGVKNVAVLFSNNQVFLSDFITQLSVYCTEKKDIMLAGWQNVITYDNIDQEYLNKLSYTFPAQNNLGSINSYSLLIKDYQQQMSSDPDNYFFQGFDIGQYYLQNLKILGPDFAYQLDKLPFEANYTRFKFYRPDESTGFENKGVYIFKYNNYQLQNTLWK